MRTLNAPATEATLFDLEATAWWSTQLSPNALRLLRAGWQGLFQRTIFALLQRPAESLGGISTRSWGGRARTFTP
ncbi:MAG TPA: hypothetical protein VGO11_18375 [Chthoniobacteraceae bacterium]|jgi:hypothetical protein|nr:hypothetical protein [Chthoniobacteraceae bacterium]